DHGVGDAGNGHPGAVAGDDVAGAGGGPADHVAGSAGEADPGGVGAQRGGAGDVGADVVTLDEQAVVGPGTADVDADDVAGDDVAGLAVRAADQGREAGVEDESGAHVAHGGIACGVQADDVALDGRAVAGGRVELDAENGVAADDVAGPRA